MKLLCFFFFRTTTNIAIANPDENVEEYDSEEEYIRPVKRQRSSSNGDQIKLLENIANTFKESNTKRNDLFQHFMKETKPPTELEVYFNSICLTVDKFDPLEQAKVKMQISQIVSQAELAQLEKSQRPNSNWTNQYLTYDTRSSVDYSMINSSQQQTHTLPSYTNL